jgi:hypothetical protein
MQSVGLRQASICGARIGITELKFGWRFRDGFWFGSPKGAERIAAAWADARKVTQIAYRPDWTRHAKAAPFKRNDALLDALPIGVMVFPGTGIQDNLADKARKLGIPVWTFGGGGT